MPTKKRTPTGFSEKKKPIGFSEKKKPTQLVTVRLSPELVERINKLIPRLADTDLAAAGEINQSVLIRLALMRGVAALEKEYGR